MGGLPGLLFFTVCLLLWFLTMTYEDRMLRPARQAPSPTRWILIKYETAGDGRRWTTTIPVASGTAGDAALALAERLASTLYDNVVSVEMSESPE
jgi:hypothetical protein